MFLLLSSLLIMGLLSNVVSAQEEGAGLGEAFDTIRELFAFLPELVTLEKLIGGDTAAIFWAKFLVWLLLFAGLFFGAGKVFPDNNRIAVIVALVIALMGALLIPNSVLINIFQTYGLVAGIVVWTIPLIAGMYISHKVENPFARALIYGLAAWILFSINNTVVKEQGFANTNFPFFGLLLAVVIILFFWNLGQIFGIGGGGGSGSGGGFGDWLTGGGDSGGGKGLFGGGKTPEEKEEEAKNKIEAQAKKVTELTQREQNLMNRVSEVDIDGLNTDIKIKDYLKELSDFIGRTLGSTLAHGGPGYTEFVNRKNEINAKLKKVAEVVIKREEKDKRVKEIIEHNEKLFGQIIRRLQGEGNIGGAIKKNIQKSFGMRKGKTSENKVNEFYNKLTDKTKVEKRIAGIGQYLEHTIKKEHDLRIRLLDEIKNDLGGAIKDLDIIEADLVNVKRKPPREPFKKVTELLNATIQKLEGVIKIDEEILERDKKMKVVLEKLLKEGYTAPTGGPINPSP